MATAEALRAGQRAELARELRARSSGRPDRVLLETCHRVELYGVGPPEQRLPAFCSLGGEDAMRRLFRVAAGLESAVVGEDDVLHQVRQALAGAGRRLDQRLARLFESAIGTGRAVRAAPLPRPSAGLADAAVAWLAGQAELSGRTLLVAGAGRMGRSLARAAGGTGANVVVASRTPGRADLDLEQAARIAPKAAAVAVALSGEWRDLERVDEGLPPVADLSAPPALPAAVRARLSAGHLGIDDLWRPDRPPEPSGWTAQAEAAVTEGVAEYLGWLRGRDSVAVLAAVRTRSEDRRRARVERLLRRLPSLSPRERELVDAATRQLVSDLLHEPLSELRSDPDGSRRSAARTLFRL